MKNNTNKKPSASTNRHSLRGPNGRFVSVGNRTVVKVNLPKRDSKGRFTSKENAPVTTVKATPKSSFISSMIVSGDLVNVVMSRNLKTTYTYKPTKSGLNKVQSAIKNGGSLGSVYNSELRGREVHRVIYK